MIKKTKNEKKQLKMLRKLRNDHIYQTSHSLMNVRLAAQVLSSSVAKVMNLHGGEEAKETAKYIANMDRFFDCLNTRSLTEGIETQKDSLPPYTDMNDIRFNFLDEFLRYLEQWKISVQTRPGNFTASQRSNFFGHLRHTKYHKILPRSSTIIAWQWSGICLEQHILSRSTGNALWKT